MPSRRSTKPTSVKLPTAATTARRRVGARGSGSRCGEIVALLDIDYQGWPIRM
jgi:hypothetical protein